MSIEKLHSYHALKPGSQVWILPEKNLSQWTRYLDWHMNFLISRAEKREQKNIPQIIKHTLVNEEIHFDFTPDDKMDLTLIATKDYFPNISTVLIKNYQSPEQWLKKILEINTQLKPKSLRVFLPQSCDTNLFLKISKKAFEDMMVTIVEDLKVSQ